MQKGKKLFVSISLVLIGYGCMAQDNRGMDVSIRPDQADSVIAAYKHAYEKAPADGYADYLDVLLKTKEYKDAEKLVYHQQTVQQRNPLLFIDMGRVYQLEGKSKKADEQFLMALQTINGDDILTQSMAQAFSKAGKDDLAIRTYERGREMTGNAYFYNSPLARLYAKTGDIEKAVNALFETNQMQFGGGDNAKVTMLDILGNDPKKLQLAQKALVNKINTQPDNLYFIDLLTWLYTQKGDWDGALMQMEALDERDKGNGSRTVTFGLMAMKEKQYPTAIKAFKEVLEKGENNPLYPVATDRLLEASYLQLQSMPVKRPAADSLVARYEAFLKAYPQYYTTHTAQDFAAVAARYANNPQKGIDILQKTIGQNGGKDFTGNCKLQLGDYYILAGKVWDASLMYSQVDKEFKQDALGEDARFRNAKLAYYRGDFEWAQTQLSVLKASTSELIANDALALSILITENVTTDSNQVPLKRFAYADLLLFQNKDKEAEALLDSISTAWPKHPLNDDILMMRASIATKATDYNKALGYLKTVYEQYGKDVLGDDAVFKTAEIYDEYLHNKEEAKKYYEQLIIDYPGSTFVQTARKRLAQLNEPL